MNDQEVLAGFSEIVEEIAGVPANEVTPGKSFVGDLDIDSLSMVEIAVAGRGQLVVPGIPASLAASFPTAVHVLISGHVQSRPPASGTVA